MSALQTIDATRMEGFNLLRAYFRESIDPLPGVRGELKRFGEHAGINPRYLPHIIAGRKNIGDELARRLEVAFGMDTGWMDERRAGDVTVGSMGRPKTAAGTTPAKDRQAQARARAAENGGTTLSITLSPEATLALSRLQADQGDTKRDAVERALIEAARKL